MTGAQTGRCGYKVGKCPRRMITKDGSNGRSGGPVAMGGESVERLDHSAGARTLLGAPGRTIRSKKLRTELVTRSYYVSRWLSPASFDTENRDPFR